MRIELNERVKWTFDDPVADELVARCMPNRGDGYPIFGVYRVEDVRQAVREVLQFLDDAPLAAMLEELDGKLGISLVTLYVNIWE